MSKHQRIAAYFTDGASRWALVDNLGLVGLKHEVLIDEPCPIRANAAPSIEMYAGGLRPDEPLIIFPGGAEIKKLADHHPNYLTELKAVEYKVILQKHQLFVWFENGYQVWFSPEVRSYLSPTFIYNLYLELISSPTHLISRYPIITNVYKTLANYKTCHKDYFGWVSPEDHKANPSFANAEPIVINQYASRYIDMFRLMTPPSLSVVPDKPNTLRILAKEGSEAVWDADTIVRHILSAPCPLKQQSENNLGYSILPVENPEPTEEELKQVKQEVTDYLVSTHPMLQSLDSILELYVAKSSHEKFYREVYQQAKKYDVPVATAFIFAMGIYPTGVMLEQLTNSAKEKIKVKLEEKSKKAPRFRFEIASNGYLNIVGGTGCLTIYQKGDTLNTTLKELYKLRELTLIGENVITAQTLLAVFEDTTLTLQSSQLMGNIISMKGRNIFRNVLVETGAYEDVNINAKLI